MIPDRRLEAVRRSNLETGEPVLAGFSLALSADFDAYDSSQGSGKIKKRKTCANLSKTPRPIRLLNESNTSRPNRSICRPYRPNTLEMTMATYMFLLYNGANDFDGVSPEDMQGVIERYRAWGESLEKAGKLVGSEKLVDEQGRVLRSADGKISVTDGPFSETKELIGGYFAITAENYDEAVELAKGCPHLDFGTLEIREVDAMH